MANQFNYPVWNLIRLDRDSETPLYAQIFAQFRTSIIEGMLPRGTRLPPSRILAKELSLARNTVVQSYDRLEAEGYVRRIHGSGTFVDKVLPEDHQTRAKPARPTRPPGKTVLSERATRLIGFRLPSERSETLGLSPGVPALDEFPYEIFSRIAARHWRSRAISQTGYGMGHPGAGLTQQIATYLAEARGLACAPEQVIVIGSTLQAAALVAHVLLDAGDEVAVEDPGHLAELATFELSGLRIRPVPVDEMGLDAVALPIRADEGPLPKLIVVSPVEQFPFGCSMPPARRQALLAWAQAHGSWVLEDDFNSEIRWSGQAQPPLFAADTQGCVIYTSSFNRALAPGLRLAYLVVPPGLVEAFTTAQRVFSLYAPQPDQALIAAFMAEGHLAAHLRRMRAIYRERSLLLAQHLRQRLGERFVVPHVTAGLHMTIRPRVPFDDAAAAASLLGWGFDCPPLSQYCRGPAQRGLVLGFGNTSTEKLPACAEAVARAVETACEPAR
ncbi:PLP-dependent aminotransferase family protein [Bosea sp. F3-2]|uniref:MocR-like pyridoxine biosynthesis transcription factor PdxR n=1 Tax=Bosea sp. F3-2 TaxID=2599640 RepID=UPI0011EFFAAA|nr:PLP-dependent aminotransferase family protein [Bosea sp. F3-2]QEL25331.1 PLP-dependent aminotransferase family protein [Bosea sp. F3-2]